VSPGQLGDTEISAGTNALLHGEEIAVDILGQVGRADRSTVHVRVVGNDSMTWVDLCDKWGACVEAVVIDNAQLSAYLRSRYNCQVLLVSQGRKLPPHEPWHGIVFASACAEDVASLQTVFDAWLPGDMIIAVHGSCSRREVASLVPKHSTFYLYKISRARHSEFGGAMTSVWNFIHLARITPPISFNTLMTSEHYRQTLQASLDDTEGQSQDKFHFESCEGKDYIGNVMLLKTKTELRVYDADGLAPDLAALARKYPTRFLFFWVLAASVWKRGCRILRPVRLHELFAIWDFEGKLECQAISRSQSITLLLQRLNSPPGKLSRLLAHHVLQQKLDTSTDAPVPLVVPIKAGKSEDIPFSPMEQSAEVRAEAACPDDAEIDTSIWAPNDETLEQAHARAALRRLAVKWWSNYHVRLAESWLDSHKKDRANIQAVADCVRRIKACRYFKWVRGSRILFYRLPLEWQEEFRDGIKAWQIPGTILPVGRMQNIATDTREHRILTREKIFRMRFQWYLENRRVRLVIPRFTVPKADDVRVVWDSKANGHNACLWAPSFILGDFRDLEEITVNWLTLSVMAYLLAGSPDQDYTQDATEFIKSWQVDIDVGQQFHNYASHHCDRPYAGVRMIDTRNELVYAFLSTSLWRSMLPSHHRHPATKNSGMGKGATRQSEVTLRFF
jgi:hypothetical protein